MKTREETAVEFAAAMGGTLHSDGDGATRVSGPHPFTIPPADAPLPDAFAFVGHVAEALPEGFRFHGISRTYVGWDDAGWIVTLWGAGDFRAGKFHANVLPDLPHAAMLAAIEAKRGAL